MRYPRWLLNVGAGFSYTNYYTTGANPLQGVTIGSTINGMATTLVRVQGNIQWQCFQANGGNWLGVCEPLKLTVQAQTWAELMEDIGLTLAAVMKDLFTSNELPKFLMDKGWTLIGAFPTHQDVRFDVPFIPAMMGANGTPRELYQ